MRVEKNFKSEDVKGKKGFPRKWQILRIDKKNCTWIIKVPKKQTKPTTNSKETKQIQKANSKTLSRDKINNILNYIFKIHTMYLRISTLDHVLGWD